MESLCPLSAEVFFFLTPMQGPFSVFSERAPNLKHPEPCPGLLKGPLESAIWGWESFTELLWGKE